VEILIEVLTSAGKRKKLSSFEEYLKYGGLSMALYNPKALKRRSS